MINEADHERYSIAELSELAGVSRRTVRFYVQTRLIPPPLGAGRGSYYTRAHLDAILQARRRQSKAAYAPPVPTASSDAVHFQTGVLRVVRLSEGYSLLVEEDHAVPPGGVLSMISGILGQSEDSIPDEEGECSDEQEE
ncbi:MAG: MerR family transcriptional regulator [Candidatus Fermentibacter daniensis]|jgi:hypothetical protein|nr:MAG: hypothetical protein AO395_02500 [Candidatus Fermentibacter daniensis]MBP7720580.1 MerR family transcriptional regulator [Candidatus Fermentibacter sp.]OQC68357.1 MAG: MerR family regulatory protein [candidate division Hyd24-12 bacterium ADurb.Bin004]KZD19744.1 MAG: hypothetical protein AO396_01635 [Candidatus Fermentibacter daniensis]NLI02591.1 MerR family transcriptional regulator [Candidatus Fermentibacter daniensis]